MPRLTIPTDRIQFGLPVGPTSRTSPSSVGNEVVSTITEGETNPSGNTIDDLLETLFSRHDNMAAIQELVDKTRKIAFDQAVTWSDIASSEDGRNYGRFKLIMDGTEVSSYQNQAYTGLNSISEGLSTGGERIGLLWAIPDSADRSTIRVQFSEGGRPYAALTASQLRAVPSTVTISGIPDDYTAYWLAHSDTQPYGVGNLANGASAKIQLSAHSPIWEGLLEILPTPETTDVNKIPRATGNGTYELVSLAVFLSALFPSLSATNAGDLITQNTAGDGYDFVSRVQTVLSILGTIDTSTDGGKLVRLNSTADGFDIVDPSTVGHTGGIPIPTVDDAGEVVGVDSNGQLTLIPPIAGGEVNELWMRSNWILDGNLAFSRTNWTLTDEGTDAGVTLGTFDGREVADGGVADGSIHLPRVAPGSVKGFFIEVYTGTADSTIEDTAFLPWGSSEVITLSVQDHNNVNIGCDLRIRPRHDRDQTILTINVNSEISRAINHFRIYGVRTYPGNVVEGDMDARARAVLRSDIYADSSANQVFGTDENNDYGWHRRFDESDFVQWDRIHGTDADNPSHFWGTTDTGEWTVLPRSELGGYTLQKWATATLPNGNHTSGDAMTSVDWTITQDGSATGMITKVSGADHQIVFPSAPPVDGVFHLVAKYLQDGAVVDWAIFKWGADSSGWDATDRRIVLRYTNSDSSVHGFALQPNPSSTAGSLTWSITPIGLGHSVRNGHVSTLEIHGIVHYTGTASQSQIDARIRANGVISSPEINSIVVSTRAEFNSLSTHDEGTLTFFTD